MGFKQGQLEAHALGLGRGEEPQRLPSAAPVGVSAVDDVPKGLPPTPGAPSGDGVAAAAEPTAG